MDWHQLRSQFPVTRQVFLDHAGVSASSSPAYQALQECSSDILHNGSSRVGYWFDRANQTRHAIGRLINAQPTSIALVANTTTAIGLVAEGFPWKSGDNLVLPSDEYPSNVYPWMNLADRGVEIRWVPPRGNRLDLDDIHHAIDSKTRLIAVSWVSYASGYRIDLSKLVELARSARVMTCVDVIQGLGALPLDVAQTPVDFVTCGSHKWLLGFQGAGFLYVRPDLLNYLHPRMVGAHSVVDPFNYGNIDFTLNPDAGRWEGGTLNLPGLAAWGASIDLLLKLGPAAVANRIRHLTDLLVEQAKTAELTVFSDRDHWSGIVSLATGDRDPKELMIKCRSAGVIVNYRGGRLRVSPHCYNNEADLERFIEVVKN
jgi:selenocysteine lyase/cysteine desulfurase